MEIKINFKTKQKSISNLRNNSKLKQKLYKISKQQKRKRRKNFFDIQ